MKIMITSLLAIVVMAVSAFAGNADTRARLMILFADRHYVPRLEAIQKSGEEIPGTLKEMADDENLLTFIRIRAVNALGFFSGTDVDQFLRATASSGTTQVGVRSEAISALGNSRGDNATKFIAGFLNDDDLLIRKSAANSLTSIGSAKANSALRKANRAKKKTGDAKPTD